MAAKTKKKDKMLNMFYSLGAAVVILGALFKINHWAVPGLPFLDGTVLLAIGLIAEALIFIIFAFDPPAGDYEWEKAYPELVDGTPVSKKATRHAEPELEKDSLSKRLDELFKEARIDAELVTGLKHSFEKLGHSVEALNQSTDDAKTVSEQLNVLSGNLSSLNGVYGGMLSAMSGKNNG
ncbi:MAG: gliding motility protein GldL [Flavobacteriales bacterium]